MIYGWVRWASGRQVWLPIVLWAAAFVVVFLYWYVPIWSGPWSSGTHPYAIFASGYAPLIAGLIGSYGILPHLDWVDAQSSAHAQARDLTALVIEIAAFSFIPIFVRWLISLGSFYTLFVPSEYEIHDPATLSRDVPFAMIWPYTLFIAGILGFGALATGIVGRRFGPILGLFAYFAVVMCQGHSILPLVFPRMMLTHYHPVSAILPILLLLAGLALFRRTASGVRAVLNL